MRLTAVYRILPRDDDFFEVCDECGFDGALVDMSTAAALMRSLGDRWASVFSHSEELLRARPAPETWCPVEYAQHTTFAIGAIEWAAGEFAAGRSPDWTREPEGLAGQFEHEMHDCDRFELAGTIEALGSAAMSMATFATTLTLARHPSRNRAASAGVDVRGPAGGSYLPGMAPPRVHM